MITTNRWRIIRWSSYDYNEVIIVHKSDLLDIIGCNINIFTQRLYVSNTVIYKCFYCTPGYGGIYVSSAYLQTCNTVLRDNLAFHYHSMKISFIWSFSQAGNCLNRTLRGYAFFSEPESLCHGVAASVGRRPSSVVRRLSSVNSFSQQW